VDRESVERINDVKHICSESRHTWPEIQGLPAVTVGGKKTVNRSVPPTVRPAFAEIKSFIWSIQVRIIVIFFNGLCFDYFR
jgi:hypothetical protein